jgi:hypothetical protein
VTPLDLDAIRSRANAADASWLPRWVPHDVRCLVSEILHLRGVIRTQNEKAALHGEAIIAQQRLTVEARSATRALEAENTALRAEIIAWLRTDATRTPPGPVSPIRRVEQAYAMKVAGIIERGEHRREETK